MSWHVFERPDGFYWWNEDTGEAEGPYGFRARAEEICDLYYECFIELSKKCHHGRS